MTDTSAADADTVSPAVKTLSPESKLPLTSTKSAPDSLIVGPVPTLPADDADEVSPVSTGACVVSSSSSVITSSSGQKHITELPSTCPTKRK